MSHLFSPRAEQDVRDIWRWVATDNEPAADALVSALFETLDMAVRDPLMGIKRPDLGEIARILVVDDFVVICEPVEAGLLVVAIIHGARDVRHRL